MDLLAKRKVCDMLLELTYKRSLFSVLLLEDEEKGSWKDIKEREFRNLVTSGLSPDVFVWK